MDKRKLLIFAAIIVLASVGVVVADEAGIITINILNNPSSQLYTDITNSTIHGHSNYIDSTALENITLTNSTLTIIVNGQNLTITSQGDNLTINTPTQTYTSVTSSQPLLTVTFLDSGIGEHPIIAGNSSISYNFNITVGVPTSVNFPFGKNVTHEALGRALTPLIFPYNLVTRTDMLNGSTVIVASWVDMQIVDGENRFTLFSNTTLSAEEIQSLTNDLYNAFSLAMSRQI